MGVLWLTWLGALGLALALYGMIVLLEWIYARILNAPPSPRQVSCSVILQFSDMESHVENVVRQLAEAIPSSPELFSQRVEVLALVEDSRDQTRAILERLANRYTFLNLLEEGVERAHALDRCRFPVILWMKVATPADGSRILNAIGRLAGFSAPVEES